MEATANGSSHRIGTSKVCQADLSAVVQLPAGVTCTFVDEGSANAVFAIQEPETPGGPKAANVTKASKTSKEPLGPQGDRPPAGSTARRSLVTTTHLLRISKAAPGVGPATCRDHHAYYTDVLQPLLGADCLVGQRLAAGVVRTGLTAALNAVLADRDRTGHRRPDWVGARVAADVDVALLVEDMRSSSSSSSSSSAFSFTFQFKPKWLVQSPNAPADARRCRTCALSAAAAAAAAATPSTTKHHKIKPCPMVLIAAGASGTTEDTSATATAALDDALWAYLSQHLGDDVPPRTRARLTAVARPALVRWLRTTDLFRRLAAVQRAFDPHGVLSVAGDGNAATLDKLQTAMTVRDCSCYLRVQFDDEDGDTPSPSPVSSRPPRITITAKLSDLDRKDGRRKLTRWAAQERALLDGGFYYSVVPGTESASAECWLERATAAAEKDGMETKPS